MTKACIMMSGTISAIYENDVLHPDKVPSDLAAAGATFLRRRWWGVISPLSVEERVCFVHERAGIWRLRSRD